MPIYTENSYGFVRIPEQGRGESDAEYAALKAEIQAHNRALRKAEREVKDADAKSIRDYKAQQVALNHTTQLLSQPLRPYTHHDPIHPGMQFSRPADPSDPTSLPSPPVTVIARVRHLSSLTFINKAYPGAPDRRTTYSNGMWRMRCFCGAEYQALTTNLHRLVPAALHCPACTLPKRKRTTDFRTRPGAERHLHQTYGRLYVQEWVQREGWLCICACGAAEMVRRSVDLGVAGLRRCPHV